MHSIGKAQPRRASRTTGARSDENDVAEGASGISTNSCCSSYLTSLVFVVVVVEVVEVEGQNSASRPCAVGRRAARPPPDLSGRSLTTTTANAASLVELQSCT